MRAPHVLKLYSSNLGQQLTTSHGNDSHQLRYEAAPDSPRYFPIVQKTSHLEIEMHLEGYRSRKF